MKFKKIATAICSTALAATLGVTVLSGCQEEGCHHSYAYKIDKEETCTEAGHRTGSCRLCGDVTEEVIPVNPDKHDYGEWEIDMPTLQKAGKATKLCKRNAGHKKVEVNLPVIPSGEEDEGGYDDVYVSKPATAVEEGTRTYRLINDAYGDIEVNVTIPKRAMTELWDAVLIGADNGWQVRSASGYDSQSLPKPSEQNPAQNYGYEFSAEFEYGAKGTPQENVRQFAHIDDKGELKEYWYSHDANGNPFNVYVEYIAEDIGTGGTPNIIHKYSEPKIELGESKGNILGYGYKSGANNIVGYGAEELLLKYWQAYDSACNLGTAVYPEEDFAKNNDNSVIASFSYSCDEGQNFVRYSVQFTLYPSGAINTLQIDTEIIRGYMIATDEDGNKLYYTEGDKKGDLIFGEEYDWVNEAPQYETDASGNIIYSGFKQDPVTGEDLLVPLAEDDKPDDPDIEIVGDMKKIRRPKPKGRDNRKYYHEEHDEVSYRRVKYNPQVLRTDDDTPLENKYTSESLYVDSFDVSYTDDSTGKTHVFGDEPVQVPSNRAVTLKVINVEPADTASLDFDPVSVYLRTPSGADVPLTDNFNDNDYRIIGSFSRSGRTVTVNALTAQVVTIVLKTYGGRVEKVLKLDFQKSTPSDIYAYVYTYSDAGGDVKYSWEHYYNADPLNPDSEANEFTVYVGGTFYVQARASVQEEAYADTSFNTVLPKGTTGLTVENDVEFDGKTVSKVVADKVGTYNVEVEYKNAKGNKKGQDWENFTVNVVERPELISLFRNTEYEARFERIKIGSATRAATAKFSFTVDSYTSGSIKIVVENYTIYYKFTFNDDDDTFSAQLDTDKTSADVVNIINDNRTFDFVFEVNEYYKITVTHSTGYGNSKETVALSVPKPDTEEGGATQG